MDLLVLRLAGLLNDAAGCAEAGIVRSSVAVGFVVSGVFGVDAAPGTSAAADAGCPGDGGAEDVTAAVAAVVVVVVASPSEAAAVALCNALSTSATSCAACAATGN